jgi:hypothetical protein
MPPRGYEHAHFVPVADDYRPEGKRCCNKAVQVHKRERRRALSSDLGRWQCGIKTRAIPLRPTAHVATEARVNKTSNDRVTVLSLMLP